MRSKKRVLTGTTVHVYVYMYLGITVNYYLRRRASFNDGRGLYLYPSLQCGLVHCFWCMIS